MLSRLLRNSLRLASACLLAPLPAAAQEENARAELAIMGTVPIYWGESDGIGDLLAGGGTGHWARPVLEQDYTLVPLDYLSADALADKAILFMPQPRALSGEENVALDDWVRAGGRLLLLADPWMTGESRFSIGDRRRPQDVALLSPILGRWGLELMFDEDTALGVEMREIAGTQVPVNLAGHFAPVESDTDCAFDGEGLLARCRVGQGEVTVLADAALVDVGGPLPSAADALQALARVAFVDFGDDAGQTANPAE